MMELHDPSSRRQTGQHMSPPLGGDLSTSLVTLGDVSSEHSTDGLRRSGTQLTVAELSVQQRPSTSYQPGSAFMVARQMAAIFS